MEPGTAPNSLNKHAIQRSGRARKVLLIALAVVVGGIGLYGLAGWYGPPWLVERWLQRFETAAPGRAASVAAVRFNPFTFEAELAGVELSDESTGAAFRAESLFIDISAQSLRERRPVFALIGAREPVLEQPSFGQLASMARVVWSPRLTRARVDRLEIDDGTWAFARGSEQSVVLTQLDGSLTGFDGQSDIDAHYELEATTAAGSLVESEGSLAPALDRAAGRVHFDDTPLESIPARLSSILGRVEVRGRLTLAADFNATDLLGVPEISLFDADVELTDLSLTPLTGFQVAVERADAIANIVLTSTAAGLDLRGRLEWSDASFELRDSHVTPPQTFAMADTVVVVTVDDNNAGLSINLGGQLADAGPTSLTARVPAEASAPVAVTLRAADLPAGVLSSYFAQALGRGLEAGRSDIDIAYSRRGESVSGEFHVVARDLVLAPAAAAAQRSLDLARALLENADGVIEIDLPFASNGRSVHSAVADALSARIEALTQTPSAALQPVVGGAPMANAVPFRPGDAALGDRALATIGQLAEALISRPRLGVRILAAFSAEDDRTALARQQIQLHVLLATAGPTAEARPAPVDFASPRAQDVLDEFAGERLSAQRIDEIARLFECSDSLESFCRRAYYAAIFDALVANEAIADSSLNRLARFRALSIADALSAAGIDPGRLEVVTGAEAIDLPFGIGLPIELTVAGSNEG